jgi:subtilisin-like proprotein convertase family protein
MIEKKQTIVCFLMFTLIFSSFSFAVRAQDSSINPDKVKALSELPPTPSEETSFTPMSDNLVPAGTITASPNLAIPDDAYIGTLDGNDGFGTDAGMACSAINTTALIPAGRVVSSVSANVRLTHTWIGDLTIKLRSPSGSILTILNRPSSTVADDGSDSPVGDNSNWQGSTITFADGAGPEAETMGSTIADSQIICTNDGICAYDPSPDTSSTSLPNFAGFNDGAAAGVWTMCVGDSAQLDTGTFTSWQLNLTWANVYTASPNLNVPDDGYAGGFGGIGQACSIINTTSPAPDSATVLGVYVDVDMAHTWVGDLTMKLRSPNGTTLTFLNRPGSNAADDGTGAVGNNANWSSIFLQFRDGAGPEAETLGNGLTTDQRVCLDNGVCKYDPSPDTAAQPPAAFSAFNGGTAGGNWTLCVGDSALGDVGILRSWRLKLVSPSLLPPTAASVSVSGRVSNADGLAVRGAVVSFTDSNGEARTARTNQFGFYRFEGVPVGAAYTVGIQAKSYTFAPQVVLVNDELTELNFTAEPN